jgi:hypothetical protein
MEMTRFTMVVCLVALAAAVDVARADVFMRQNQHVDAFQMMGQSQPASDTEVTIWMTDRGMRSDNPKQSAIVKLDEKVLVLLNHEQKTIATLPLDAGAVAADIASQAGGDAQLEEMMGKMSQIEVSVTATEERKKIGGWNCRKYLQTIETFVGPATTEVWATEDLEMDMDRYVDLTTAMMAMQPGMKENLAKMQGELRKIKGVRVLEKTSNEVMGTKVNSTVTLLEFKQGSAPADLFDLPEGYKRQ